MFPTQQRSSVFVSDAWPAPSTYHRSFCEHRDQRVGRSPKRACTKSVIDQSFGPKVAKKLSLFSQLSAPIKSGLRVRMRFYRKRSSTERAHSQIRHAAWASFPICPIAITRNRLACHPSSHPNHAQRKTSFYNKMRNMRYTQRSGLRFSLPCFPTRHCWYTWSPRDKSILG